MADTAFINEIVQRASLLASESTISNGRKVILSWLPPQSATSDPYGTFIYREARDE